MKLNNEQQAALDTFTQFIYDDAATYMIIQGDSGTGKSTLILEMLHLIESDQKMAALLLQEDTAKWFPVITATTNKAAAALENIINQDVKTIHSVLGLTLQHDYSTGKQKLVRQRNFNGLIEDTLLIVDEASFINTELYNFMELLTNNCKIILIGDQYQLAPVKQKTPIMGVLDCDYRAELTQIMRHKGSISDLGKQFKEAVITGTFTPIKVNGIDIIHADGDEFQSLVDQAFLAPTHTPQKATILAWTNKRVLEYQDHVKQLLGQPDGFYEGDFAISNKPCLNPRCRVCTDSLVKITKEQGSATVYDVEGKYVYLNNTSIPYFLPDDQNQVRATLKYLAKRKEWVDFYNIKNDWLDLRLAHAITVHKSQGSEYETVFLDLADIGRCTIKSDAARMLYVGITRATKKVILYGSLPQRFGGTPIRI